MSTPTQSQPMPRNLEMEMEMIGNAWIALTMSMHSSYTYIPPNTAVFSLISHQIDIQR